VMIVLVLLLLSMIMHNRIRVAQMSGQRPQSALKEKL
jgi:hypothetical protein